MYSRTLVCVYEIEKSHLTVSFSCLSRHVSVMSFSVRTLAAIRLCEVVGYT